MDTFQPFICGHNNPQKQRKSDLLRIRSSYLPFLRRSILEKVTVLIGRVSFVFMRKLLRFNNHRIAAAAPVEPLRRLRRMADV
jgi:hypothetical protein